MWQSNSQETTFWPRAIIHADMNAFFASIEQKDNPAWRGKPLAVTNGKQGTCLITCSYEARACGIKTGMRLYDARQLCPDIIQVSARPARYAEVSRTIMDALVAITPDIEIFSIDEAFLDVTKCQLLHGSPEKIGKMTKQCIWNASGLHCSVGVSGDKTTAKFAANLQKPNGLNVIPPWTAKARLRDVHVTELCGIGKGIGSFLAKHGVHTCGDMENLPISILGKRFGNLGRRMWYMCQGLDPDPVHTRVSDPKSMGHGKVMPPNTTQVNIVMTYLLHMSERLAARMRKNGLQAQHFFIGLKNWDFGWLGTTGAVSHPTQDGRDIYALGKAIFAEYWHGQPVFHIQVTAVDPQPTCLQQDFFYQPNLKQQSLNAVCDAINDRYGEFAIAPAPLLERSATPNVIAPAWKPRGHRQSI